MTDAMVRLSFAGAPGAASGLQWRAVFGRIAAIGALAGSFGLIGWIVAGAPVLRAAI